MPQANVALPGNGLTLGDLLLDFHLPEVVGIGAGLLDVVGPLSCPGPQVKFLDNVCLGKNTLSSEVRVELLVKQADDIPSLQNLRI